MIKIIDYKAGNAPSVKHAIEHLGHTPQFAREATDLNGASFIILPGVGSAQATMDSLREMEMIPTLERLVLHEKTKFLGICVGLQILFEHSEEDDCTCLGWLQGRVERFNNELVRVPQMGWNEVKFNDNTDSGFFYFVNSYHAKPKNPSDLWGVANYGNDFTAAVRQGNIFATQFHIEKSGEAGLGLLEKIIKL
jgi:glutamine amidotransferase